jgi:hypothetical protein
MASNGGIDELNLSMRRIDTSTPSRIKELAIEQIPVNAARMSE